MDKFQVPALLPREMMLKRHGDIRKTLQQGRKHTGRYFNLYRLPQLPTRFAVLIPKRIGNAVQRNKMKRLAREIYRKNRSWFSETTTLFFVKRYCTCYRTLEKEIATLAKLK